MSKINDLKSSIIAKLSAIPNPPVFSDPPHFGPLFRNIPLVRATEIHRILASCPAKAFPADRIPPSIIKACPNLFSELIAELANRSFCEGIFSSCFKHASVVPLLKKPSLDKHVPSSYKPISNLDFISKILERLFLARIQPPHYIVTELQSCSCRQHIAATIPPKHFRQYSPLPWLWQIHHRHFPRSQCSAHLYSIDQQQYADDTQLFISLSLSDYMPDLDNLTGCIDSLHIWFCANGIWP